MRVQARKVTKNYFKWNWKKNEKGCGVVVLPGAIFIDSGANGRDGGTRGLSKTQIVVRAQIQAVNALSRVPKGEEIKM